MSLTVKIVFSAVALWQCVYMLSAAVWEMKNSNIRGGGACVAVALLMSATFGAVILMY